MAEIVEKTEVSGRDYFISTGGIARQASGAVIVRCADTIVLVTAVAAKEPKKDASFFPLTVEYRESAFSFGRIPGGFFKREGKPTEHEIITSRMIDRPIRPLFPDGFLTETQVIAQPLSADPSCPPDVLAITGASAALAISDIPWNGPIAAVRVGRINGEFIANPSRQQIESSDLELIVAASKEAIVMVEGEAKEVPESVILDALDFAHKAILPLIEIQEKLVEKVGKAKRPFQSPEYDPEIIEITNKKFSDKIAEVYSITEKKARYSALDTLKKEVEEYFQSELGEEKFEEKKADIAHAFEQLKRNYVRNRIVREGVRIDGRDLTTVRPIDIKLGWLPRVHGSALFTRGETQASVTVTLGTAEDEQRVEDYGSYYYKSFIFHYNFPPYCVGEVRPLRGPGRREIGHGHLAGRSVEQVLPDRDSFPYTIRIVSDITESNGSSSMASVCGASLALMQAGVPIKRHIAGVAMGLIKEGDQIAVLTDILGDEDHLGDMDFKVSGTREGVCAIQMDIKISGLSRQLFESALEQARKARFHILDIMEKAISHPKTELSPHAPRIVSLQVNPERVRFIIGPGGRTIRNLQEQLDVMLYIEDTGKVTIVAPNEESCQRAIEMIKSLTREVEPGQIYLGIVKGVKEFGAFVEILPGQEGLLHVTQIHSEHIENVTDVLKEGDEVLVKVLEVDPFGKIRLSRKAAIEEQAAKAIAQRTNGEQKESESPEGKESSPSQ